MFVARRLSALAAGACLVLVLALPAAGRAGRRAQTEARLKAVQAAIAHAHTRVRRVRAEYAQLTRELRRAEHAESAARTALQRIAHKLAAVQAARARLASKRRARRAEMARDRAILAGELRAAYLIGRDEPLKLLLNQHDPARAGRMLAYFGYFGRARARLLGRITAQAKALKVLDTQYAGEQQRLTALESQQHAALARVEHARAARRAALVSLDAQARTQTERLHRLQSERNGLEALLTRLRRATPRRALTGPFARLRGKLSWPVKGRLAERFGDPRGGGLKWQGDLIDTDRGAPVRAVAAGRVLFANWLPGLGLLIIINHGGGYLSLYGHNERLYKKVGDSVASGALIAAAGDSGGSARPELYFGIRKGTRPLDPGPWFRTVAPAR